LANFTRGKSRLDPFTLYISDKFAASDNFHSKENLKKEFGLSKATVKKALRANIIWIVLKLK
jgi:hypothetical protein